MGEMSRLVVAIAIVLAVSASGLDQARADSSVYPGKVPNMLAKRYALVIGVGRYHDLGISQLPNAEADAKLIVDRLKALGFEVNEAVSSSANYYLTGEDILEQVYKLRAQIQSDIDRDASAKPAVLVYFAGHSFTWDGQNMLAPGNLFVRFDEDIERFSIPLSQLVKALKSNALTLFVIVDGCRDLPYANIHGLDGAATKFQAGGTSNNSTDMAGATVLFATLPPLAVPDGVDGHSPFADYLAKALDLRRIADDGYPRSFEDLFSGIRAALLGSGKYEPNMQLASTYQLPLFRTERDYQAEELNWNLLLKNFSTNLQDYSNRPDIAFPRIACALDKYLPANAASYFGRSALKLRSEIKVSCDPDSLHVQVIENGSVFRGPMMFANVRQDDVRHQFEEYFNSNKAATQPLKTRVNLRAAPRIDSGNIMETLPVGDTVQVANLNAKADTTGTWAKVIHDRLGPGYVSSDLLGSATISYKTGIKFTGVSVEVAQDDRKDLVNTFRLLSPAILIDFSVSYGEKDPAGFSRALAAAAAVNEIAARSTKQPNSEIVPAILSENAVPSGSVEIDLALLPAGKTVYQRVDECQKSPFENGEGYWYSCAATPPTIGYGAMESAIVPVTALSTKWLSDPNKHLWAVQPVARGSIP